MGKLEAVVYRDHAREWRWRIEAPNGRVVAASSESYKNRGDALANLRTVTTAGAESGAMTETPMQPDDQPTPTPVEPETGGEQENPDQPDDVADAPDPADDDDVPDEVDEEPLDRGAQDPEGEESDPAVEGDEEKRT